MKANDYTRRKFLRQLAGSSTVVAGAALFLSSCSGGKTSDTKTQDAGKAASADPCNDFSGVSADELEKRRKFGYVDKSAESGKTCGNCGLFLTWEKEKTCGGCLLFKGPVHTDGYCMQWAAKAEAS